MTHPKNSPGYFHAPFVEDESTRSFLDEHDPDLVLTAFRDAAGGPTYMRRLGSMARALLRSGARPRRVLDICSGAGDLGRTLALLERGCTVDFLDRDRFALALASRINRRRNVRGRLIEGDLWHEDWADGLTAEYDVIACAHGLSTLDEERVGEVLVDIARLLHEDGQLLLSEPIPKSPIPDSSAVEPEPTPQWHAFFRRLDRHLDRAAGQGHHRALMTRVPPGRHPIDADGLPIRTYLRLLTEAGFAEVEVVDRSSGDVSILARRQARHQKAA